MLLSCRAWIIVIVYTVAYQNEKYISCNEFRTVLHAYRLVSGIRRSDHITPVMKELHWLAIHGRIDFKILLLTCKI